MKYKRKQISNFSSYVSYLLASSNAFIIFFSICFALFFQKQCYGKHQRRRHYNLNPYAGANTWGGTMHIEDIRRKLNGIDGVAGKEPMNNTFNTIDIANKGNNNGGNNQDGLVDIWVQNVGHKLCPSPIKSCQDWQSSYINGRFTTVKNPRKHVSVLPPTSGCGTLSKVSNTAKNRGRAINNKYFSVNNNKRSVGCKVAINAGFFMRHVKINGTSRLCNSTMGNCGCLGNLVSEGKYIQTSKAINANFGVRNGKFVIGYVNEDEILHNVKDEKFNQLVSGVIWLVRNGTNFVMESANIETPETQQTSKHLMENNKQSFVDTFAARSVVGYNKYGELLIYQIDGLHGREYVPNGLKRGIDLISLADILIDLGFIEAINLDGGGSSAFILNDELNSFPSDECGKHFVCEREVTSIICIHDEIIEGNDQPKLAIGCSSNDTIISTVNIALTCFLGLLFAFIFAICGNVYKSYDRRKNIVENMLSIFQNLCPKPFKALFCSRNSKKYANINDYDDESDDDEEEINLEEEIKEGYNRKVKRNFVKQKNRNRNIVAIDVSKLEIEIPSLEVTPKNSPRSSIDESSTLHGTK